MFSVDSEQYAFKDIFSFGNMKISQGTKTGEHNMCFYAAVFVVSSRFTETVVLGDALS
jgi:hypothetical protein